MKTVPSMKLTQEGCDIIVNAGYRSIFANGRGEIFAWPQSRG